MVPNTAGPMLDSQGATMATGPPKVPLVAIAESSPLNK